MGPLSPIDQILQAMRMQAGALPKKSATLQQSNICQETSAFTTQDIPTFLAARIQSIQQDHPERRRLAFRAFLESIMLFMFGTSVFKEQAFQQLLEKTQDVMETDPQLRQAIDETGILLLSAVDRAQQSGDWQAFAQLLAIDSLRQDRQ